MRALRLQRRWQAYGAAVALTAMAFAGRLALDPWWGRAHNRHLVFFPTVMVAAGLGGVGPGLLALALSTIALDYFWMGSGRHSFVPPNSDLILFFGIGIGICVLIHSLHSARERATEARESHDRVLAIVAHDLRNAVQAIKATSSLLRKDSQDPKTRQRSDALRRAADRAERLIRDLIDVKQLERGELALTMNEETIDSIVREAVEMHAPLALEKGIQLSTTSAVDAIVRCDRGRLLQVLANLLGNAVKFTPQGGSNILRIELQANHVLFEVSDTGPGIPEEHLPHIFKRYWKANSQGLGLGLFIASSILRAHGSELRVRCEPGRGATFFFVLNRASPASGRLGTTTT